MTRRSGQFGIRTVTGWLYALTLPALLAAQTTDDASPSGQSNPFQRKSSLVQAERLVDRVIDGEPVTDLMGNVFIDRDTLTARSDTARYWRDREIYEMWGNVRLRQLETRLYCDKAYYWRLEGKADFHTNVRVEEEDIIGTAEKGESRQSGELLRLIGSARLVSPEYTVWADTIARDRLAEVSEASGNVKIIDPEARTLVTGDHAIFAADGQVAHVDRNPSLVSREQGELPFESLAGVMHFYRDDERVVMVDSVRIRQGLTSGVADTAIFLGRETLVLRGNPLVQVGEQSTMMGDEIEFRYRDEQLRNIYLYGQARMEDNTPDSLAAIYSGLPAMNILEGDTITVDIVEGQVRSSMVMGNAHSLYVPDDLTDEVAFNDVYGDTINIYFEDARVDRVFVRGNMSGTYTFARLANLQRTKSGFVPEMYADSTTTRADSTSGALIDTTAITWEDSVSLAFVDTTAGAGEDTALIATPATTGALYDLRDGAEKVVYNGHSVQFRLAKRAIEIQKEASLTYGTMTLTADEVIFDTIQRELYADGNPLLVDSEQKLVGEKMGYNFESKTGAVRNGVTSYDSRFYAGKEIKRFGEGSMKIHSGYMTSCNLAEPHYHFWSNHMKMNLDDKMFAEPVVMYIGRVPIVPIPFYFKSMKRGRRSGILFPNFNFGWNARDGRYIRDLGYYWATNDYLDFMFQVDFNERQDYNLRFTNRYVKRYGFQGGFQYNWREQIGSAETQVREWQFRWNHNQDKLFDVYSLRASIHTSSETLTSNDLSRDIGRDIISGQLRSNLTLSRRWSLLNANLGLSRDGRVNSRDDDPTTNNIIYTSILPSLSLGFQRFALKRQIRAGQKGSFLGDLLRDTYFNQGYNIRVTQQEREETKSQNYDLNGNWSLDLRPPRVSIFNLSTGVSASKGWTLDKLSGRSYVRTDSTWVDPDSTLVLEDVYEPVDQRTETNRSSLAANAGVTTTMYGVFPMSVGPLRAMRHTFRFEARYSYRPSLGSQQLKSESVGLFMSNRFDIKYLTGSARDSTAEEKKLDGLLDWSLSTTYNPATPRTPWTNIGSIIVIRPGQHRNLDIKVSNNIDPYLWKVLDTRVNYGFNISGRFDSGGEVVPEEQVINPKLEQLGALNDTTGVSDADLVYEAEGFAMDVQDFEAIEEEYDSPFAGFDRGESIGLNAADDPTAGGRYIPWTFNSNLSISRNNVTDAYSARTNFSLTARVSQAWDFRYRASFELETGRVIRQEYTLQRDLHCWRLEFSRIISDVDSQYGFRIYLTDIPAIKLNQGNEQLMGALGGGVDSFY